MCSVRPGGLTAKTPGQPSAHVKGFPIKGEDISELASPRMSYLPRLLAHKSLKLI